ncbi:class II fumarate hydratase [Lactobacillus sp. CC-MHH1034]|uniref:class II fumarate hydratase n=1 Tax=Agrilactobacillus fermenti TaxID=2586909 RepID=UPI001E2C09E1|nr:class II fumarate hydratase [Agrilactobacillus fermenti]MCD2256164.1 class II fumarate hydratase [Agrilactobacillus fermenti]
MTFRTEHDALGAVQVPQQALWGAQTQRSLENFKIGPRMPYKVVRVLIGIKAAAAKVNQQLGKLTPAKATLIQQSCRRLLATDNRQDFPLVIYQTGSGTQTNMNVNEVIVHVAAQLNPDLPLHPNDDVNLSQSSNDTFPTAMMIAASLALPDLLTNLQQVIKSFSKKVTAYQAVIKIGRTHLQDATPLTVGQELSGYQDALQHDWEYLQSLIPTLLELPIGGTAVGTGLNAPDGFAAGMVTALQDAYKLPFVSAPNKFQGLANHSGLNVVHGALKTLASDLVKIGNDIRFLASGPRAGYDEFNIPANEPGSSIMPGKVNPTQIEALTMVCARVFGNDTTITFAASQGNFELNVYKPVIIAAFLESVQLLTQALASFDQHLLQGLTVNPARIQQLVDHSLMTVTALTPHIGYEKSAQIALKAQKENSTLKDAALALGYVTAAEFDQWVDPSKMV